MADNVVVEQDAAGNIKPSKRKSTEKIDGITALVMALDRALRHELYHRAHPIRAPTSRAGNLLYRIWTVTLGYLARELFAHLAEYLTRGSVGPVLDSRTITAQWEPLSVDELPRDATGRYRAYSDDEVAKKLRAEGAEMAKAISIDAVRFWQATPTDLIDTFLSTLFPERLVVKGGVISNPASTRVFYRFTARN